MVLSSALSPSDRSEEWNGWMDGWMYECIDGQSENIMPAATAGGVKVLICVALNVSHIELWVRPSQQEGCE